MHKDVFKFCLNVFTYKREKMRKKVKKRYIKDVSGIFEGKTLYTKV